ncbi:MAG: hypothetical protein Tsb0013_13640 [Phycisphaerales bacterium]
MSRTSTAVALAAIAVVTPAALAQGPLFLSLADNIDNGLPGLSPFTDEDAVGTTLTGAPASVQFSLASGDLDALHRTGPDTWLVSSLFNGDFNGTIFDDGDLVEINTTTGTVTTVISNTLFSAGADITGVSVLPNGNYLLSTLSDATLGGLAFTDGDIIEYNATTDTATLFLSEADLFDDGDGDVYGIHWFSDGRLLLTTNVDEVISGTTFRDGDAFLYDPLTDTATLAFSEDTFVGGNTWDIDALYFEGEIPAPGALALFGGALAFARRRRA